MSGPTHGFPDGSDHLGAGGQIRSLLEHVTAATHRWRKQALSKATLSKPPDGPLRYFLGRCIAVRFLDECSTDCAKYPAYR